MRTDSAIKKKEDDLLERYDFASELVRGLLGSFVTGQDSIAVGLNGEWGAGKSSILEFVETEIGIQTEIEPYSNIVFRFNPWLFAGQTDLQRVFLTQLGVHLGTINPQLKKLGEDIVLISSIIEITNVLNPDLISRKLIGSGTKIVQKIAKKIGSEPSLQALKKRIDDALESSSIKVFVIIDDIDRLIPSEIANIFRLVNLNANFKNTFFFLAYDKSIVMQALTSEFHLKGEQFLEKIIQLDYAIPKLSPELLHELFFNNFNKLAVTQGKKVDKREIGRIWNVGLKDYFSNLRHIYRFFNALEIRLPIIREDVNIIDFTVIEAIRIFNSNAYEWIYQNRENLIYQNNNIPLLDEKKESLLDFLKKDKKLSECETTVLLINSLFYAIHLSEMSFSNEKLDKEKLEREKRIVHKDFFDHYFSFKLSRSNIPESKVLRFIKSENEGRNSILEEYKNGKLSVFLKRVFFSLPSDDTFKGIQKYILNYADKEELNLIREDEFSFDGLFIVVSFLNDIGNKFGYENYLEEILASNDSYSRFYLKGFLRNRVNGSSNIEPARYFPKELIDANSERILASFKNALLIFSDKLLSSPLDYEISIISNLLRLLHEEEIDLYEQKVKEFLGDIELTVLLFMCSVTVLNGGGKVSYSIQNEKYILPNLTIEQFDDVLGEADLENYHGKNKNYLALFQKLKEKKFNPYYHFTLELEMVEF